ncbi:MAG: FAD:protein FMN transferase [bacterium]|nr:FAD:protein FMN transferase [bacterium]MDT8366454.1 FAD:protein FMN transferase [bacterium]
MISLSPWRNCDSRYRSLFLGSFLLILAILSGCSDPQPHRETRFMMGTLVDVVVYAGKEAAPGAAGQAFERILQVEAAAHPSEEGSPLFQVRQGKGARLEGDLTRILEAAMDVSRAASGAFDPTLGEVVYLWGFGRDDPHLPGPEEIQQALEKAGYKRVPVGQCCPEKLDIWFDLGGVAKGYAVDAAVSVLQEAGVKAGIVNAGGDLRSFGVRPGRGYWKIGVQDPENPQELAGVLEVKEAAVATSGDYQRYFEEGGIRYHHILDPSTGYPVHSGLRGTTVISSDCATADALATAAFVLGPEKGLALLEKWDGAEGVLITGEGKILTTSGIGEGGVRFTKTSD